MTPDHQARSQSWAPLRMAQTSLGRYVLGGCIWGHTWPWSFGGFCFCFILFWSSLTNCKFSQNILHIFPHTSYFTHFSLANHSKEILIFDCWSLVIMCKGMCLHCSFLLCFELHSLQLCHCTGLVCGQGKQEKLQGMLEAVSSMFLPWQYTLSLLVPHSISTLIFFFCPLLGNLSCTCYQFSFSKEKILRASHFIKSILRILVGNNNGFNKGPNKEDLRVFYRGTLASPKYWKDLLKQNGGKRKKKNCLKMSVVIHWFGTSFETNI